jgi:hypothetical protein
MAKKKEVVVYQAKSGAIELRGDFSKETIWATQAQIADVFRLERSVVTKHIRNILKDKELNAKSVSAKFAHTAEDGKTYQVQFYNLDLVLAVGYRANSARAIEFRQWATRVLREHITEGYTLNRKQLAKNYEEFMKAVAGIQAVLPSHMTLDPAQVLELIKEFASTWVSLDAYDREALTPIGVTKKAVAFAAEELAAAIATFRDSLMKSGEATENFAAERERGSIHTGYCRQCDAVLWWHAALSDRRGEGCAPALLHGEESPLCGRQQAFGRLLVCLVSPQGARAWHRDARGIDGAHAPHRRERSGQKGSGDRPRHALATLIIPIQLHRHAWRQSRQVQISFS